MNWVETLPFPISSILWRYIATKDFEKKIVHAFHFFEAFSEFISMIMLSGLVRNNEFYQNESHKWIETDDKFKEWYKRATFGNWNMLASRLSKSLREYYRTMKKKNFVYPHLEIQLSHL